MEFRDLLGGVLVDGVTIRHLQRVGVLEVDLVLAEPGFSLRELHGDPRGVDAVTDGADDVLVARRLQHVIVLDVRAVRTKTSVVAGSRVFVALAEEEELELRAALHRVAGGMCARHLAPEDLAGRDLHRLARLDVAQVAQHERGLLEPRQLAQRGEIRLAQHVAVPGLPAREAIAGQRVHVDVDREQVGARVDAVLGDVAGEEVPGDALAHQAALQVGEGDDDGVDLAAVDRDRATRRVRGAAGARERA